jgi:hypothetical protein
MKNLFTLALLFSLTSLFVVAQDKTTVTANSSEISDNLDLRAIATIFGEASNLEDFEKRINDPKAQISNLDLNDDNYVDYLRVIESIEDNVHLIIIQSVIDEDKYQDIASIEVEKDKDNNVQVQVVGDVYMYGDNYIYEPVYVTRPIIYSTFWVNNYNPYYSSWYWGYYPSYYSFWNPFPIFRYRNHINVYIGGYGHVYNYVNVRRCHVAYNNYYGRRSNAYEVRYPNRSFRSRNATVSNRYELDNTRNTRTVNSRERGDATPRIETSRNENKVRGNNTRSESNTDNNGVRGNGSTRNETVRTDAPSVKPTRENTIVRENGSTRNETIKTKVPTRSETIKTKTPTRVETPSVRTTTKESSSTRTTTPKVVSPSRSTTTPKATTAPSRSASPRTSSPSRSSTPKATTPSRSSSRGTSSRGGRG